MTTNSLIFGDLDTTGFLIISLIALASVGGFVFVAVFIFTKVFRGRKASLTAINLSKSAGAEAGDAEGSKKVWGRSRHG